MILQQSYVYIYHDDYGYASLSYAVNPSTPVHGHIFTASQFVEFLEKHYQSWGGRVLFFGFEILSLRWGLWPYRVVQAVILTSILSLIFILVQHDIKNQRERDFIDLLLCCFFGLIDINLHRNGTYWATAAAIYVWPFTALLSAAVLHMRWVDSREKPITILLLFGILYFISGWSQEQFGLISITVVPCLTFIHLKGKAGKKILFLDLFCILCVLTGYIILILAPGNQVRMNFRIYEDFNNLSIFDKIKSNLPHVISLMFGNHDQWFNFLWILACTTNMFIIFRSTLKHRWIYLAVSIICFILGLILISSYIPAFNNELSWIYKVAWSKKYLAFWGVFIAATCLATVLFCLYQKNYLILSIFIGGVLSQTVLLISPSLNLRSALIFLFSLFPVLALMIGKLKSTEIIKSWFIWFIVLSILVISISNTIFLIRGYAQNDRVMHENDRILATSAQAISDGADIPQIILQKLPDNRFGGEMPYTEGYNYINIWIKNYYDIPASIELIWK